MSGQKEKLTNSASITEPLPAGLPHIAYILLWYPLFTQPFIFREVESLSKILPLQVYTLYGQNLRHCSNEMLAAAKKPVTFGLYELFPLMWGVISTFISHPVKIMRLFRKTVLKPWKSLEIFGENLWAFGVGVTLAKRFKEDGIDFIYAPWPRGAATAARVASQLSGIPFGIAVRGDNLCPADPDLSEKLSEATAIRANNLADQKRISDFAAGIANSKTKLIYNSLTLPVTEIITSPQPGKAGLRILALGRFDVTKGFDVLLNACAILKGQKFPFHLTLAGGGGKLMGLGNLEPQIKKLVKELHLENEVSMPGLISHNELPALMESHDVFAAPCVVHKSGRRDGIPNTIIEAMAFGLPIVATNVNALPEVIKNGETGLSVPPSDPQALANALVWLKDNPQEAARLGNNASRLAREMFNPETNARKLADFFINACKKSDACVA